MLSDFPEIELVFFVLLSTVGQQSHQLGYLEPHKSSCEGSSVNCHPFTVSRNNTLKAPIHGTGGDGGFLQADLLTIMFLYMLSHKQICNILVG